MHLSVSLNLMYLFFGWSQDLCGKTLGFYFIFNISTLYKCVNMVSFCAQIDTRLLKAVAIEHSKDADAAATIVLTEILPYWSKKSLTSSSVILNRTASSSSCVSDCGSDEIGEVLNLLKQLVLFYYPNFTESN